MTHIKLTNIDASFYLKFKIENGKLKVMKKLFLIIILALFFNVNGQQTTDNGCELSAVSNQQSVNTGIIPTPQFAEICDFNNSTNNFVIDESCLLVDIGENEEISKIINTFKNDIKEITGVDLKVSKKGIISFLVYMILKKLNKSKMVLKI